MWVYYTQISLKRLQRDGSEPASLMGPAVSGSADSYSPWWSQGLLFLISPCQNLSRSMSPRPAWSLLMFKHVIKWTPLCFCLYSQWSQGPFCVDMTAQPLPQSRGFTRMWIRTCSWSTFCGENPHIGYGSAHMVRSRKGKRSSAHDLSCSHFPLRIDLLLSWVKIHTCDICLALVFLAAAVSSFPAYTQPPPPGLSHKDSLFI